jgi:cysteine desulfurase
VVERALEAGPALLVAVMWANNEVGTVQPIAEIGAVCRAAGVTFLCDAVQAAGKVPVSVAGVDLMALAAHKLYGPKGVGALYIRSGLRLEPLIHGAQHEAGRRAGTSPVAQIVGMGAAAALARESLAADAARLSTLRDRLEARLLADIPGTVVHSREVARLPNTCAVSFEGVAAWELQPALDRRGIAISAGAACRSGIPKPSATLTAMGVSSDQALGGIRLSLGRHTTDAEIDTAAVRVAEVVRRLREAR